MTSSTDQLAFAIERSLIVSTSHITKRDSEILTVATEDDNLAYAGRLVVHALRHGFLIYAGSADAKPTPVEIGSNKRWVIPPRFTHAQPFRDGLAPVKEGDQWKVIDSTGETVFELRPGLAIADISAFSEGFALMTIGQEGINKLIDTKGKIPFENIVYAFPFSDGLAAVSNWATQRDKAKWHYIDTTGQVVIPGECQFAGPFREGLAPVQFDDGSWWLIDKKGGGVVHIEGVDAVYPFREGRAPVRDAVSGLWGYVDKAGRLVIKCSFTEICGFFEGAAAARIPGNAGWGYIVIHGRLVIPHELDRAGPFEAGRATVTKNGLRMQIDHAGKTLWSMREIPSEAVSLEYYNKPEPVAAGAPVTAATGFGSIAELTEGVTTLLTAKRSEAPLADGRLCTTWRLGPNTVRLITVGEVVKRIEILGLLRRPDDAHNRQSIRVGGDGQEIIQKAPDIEGEQRATLEQVTQILSRATHLNDPPALGRWLAKIWMPEGTKVQEFNSIGVAYRMAVYRADPQYGMGLDEDGQLLAFVLDCEHPQNPPFGCGAQRIPEWAIGAWGEDDEGRRPFFVLDQKSYVYTVPASASVDRKEHTEQWVIDNAFDVGEKGVAVFRSANGETRSILMRQESPDTLHDGDFHRRLE